MTRETEYVVDCSSQVAGRPGLGRPRTADRGGQTGKAGGVTRACSRKKCRPHLRAGPSRGGAAGQAVGVKESGRAEEAGQAAGRRQPPPTRPQAHLSSVSSAPSCLSSGRPSAARRSLLSSSAARQYWACSSPPLGYVCWMNFTSGLARSTSEVFFSCTEMNAAMASASAALRAKDTTGRRRGPRAAEYRAGGRAD